MEETRVATAARRAKRETSSAATKVPGNRGLTHRRAWQSERTTDLRGRLTAVLLSVLALLITLAGPTAAEPADAQWDPTLPKIVSSGAPGDPVAVANASLQATQLATQTTMELGRKFLSSLGLGGPGAGAPTGAVPGSLNRVNGRQAIEYVIRRGASQAGVPYSWGGGKPNGPSLGVDSGANTG